MHGFFKSSDGGNQFGNWWLDIVLGLVQYQVFIRAEFSEYIEHATEL